MSVEITTRDDVRYVAETRPGEVFFYDKGNLVITHPDRQPIVLVGEATDRAIVGDVITFTAVGEDTPRRIWIVPPRE